MKRRILFFASIGILAIIPMIVLQSSTPPPAPTATSVILTGCPTNYYAIMVDLNGYTYVGMEDYAEQIVRQVTSSTWVFTAATKLYHDGDEESDASFAVWYKQYSYSSWTLRGSAHDLDEEVTCDVYGTFLGSMSISWSNLPASSPL